MFFPFFYISVICQKNVFNFNLYLKVKLKEPRYNGVLFIYFMLFVFIRGRKGAI